MTIDPYLLSILGMLLLYLGAEWLIRGSASLSLRLGISTMVIGLTVVGYGTSFPELIVSLQANMLGHGEIALGNVMGSNICNIGLVLGIFALIAPRKIPKRLVHYDIPLLITATLILGVFFWNREVTRYEGLFLIALLFIYTFWAVYSHTSEEEKGADGEEVFLPKSTKNFGVDLGLILAGFAGLLFGSSLFLQGAIHIAKTFGISDAVIGLTLVAIGTSLPELVTSAVAAFRRHSDLALGNIIGSNIYNILSIIGFSSLVNPITIKEISVIDYLVLLGFSILLYITMRSRLLLSRREGLLLLTAFCLYFGYLFYYHPSLANG